MSYAGGNAAEEPSVLPPPSRPKTNPFGAARPREQVIAEREGKRETEVLKEQVRKEWQPTMSLTTAQFEEKKALEAEISYARSELDRSSDPARTEELKEEVASKERKLEELLLSFEKMSVRPARRERRKEEPDGSEAYSRGRVRDGPQYADAQDYNSFSRKRDTDFGSWGGGRGGKECYSCNQVGHISRDCPNNPRGGMSYGSGSFSRGGGGGACYNCREEGHIARDCPNAGGGYGSFGGGYQDDSRRHGGGYEHAGGI